MLADHGCLACHTSDGRAGPGPTFTGLFGRSTRVVTEGETREIEIDEAYVARSIRDPGHDVVEGFPAMPQLSVPDEDIDALVAALRELPEEEPPFESIWPLAFGTLGFLVIHLLLSLHPIRRRVIDKHGHKVFTILFSVAVLIPFAFIFGGWMVRPFVPLFDLGDGARWVPMVLMPFAFIFLIAGYSTKNPATTGQESALSSGPTGIVTITRHPALWGFGIWALAHLLSNGDLASLLLFGSFAALSFLGMLHIDRRRARAHGEAWHAFVKQTSIMPFVAIVTGRCKLDLGGLWWRALAGLAATAAMLALHEWEMGVSPFPYW